jgi:outer membrane protein assembly factor BamB
MDANFGSATGENQRRLRNGMDNQRKTQSVRHCANPIYCYADVLFSGDVHGLQIVFRRASSHRNKRACAGRRRGPGVWLTQAGDAKVRVTKCGGGICGIIVWLKEPIDAATGKPAVDDKNANPMLAKRPMIGLPLLSAMRPEGQNRWSGQIYNADDGKGYVSHLRGGRFAPGRRVRWGAVRRRELVARRPLSAEDIYAAIAFSAVAADA